MGGPRSEQTNVLSFLRLPTNPSHSFPRRDSGLTVTVAKGPAVRGSHTPFFSPAVSWHSARAGYRSSCSEPHRENEVSIMTASKIPFLAIVSIFALSSSLAFADQATQAKLHAEARISEADTRTMALAKVPGGSISSSELEKKHGRLIWSFDIAQVGSKNITEVQVDAKTGKIVSTKIETPDKERQEGIAEKKAGKTH